MQKIIIGYSRHDLLGDSFSNDYRFEARRMIDTVADEIEKLKDTCIKSMYVNIKTVEWEENNTIESVYQININEHFSFQFRIRDFKKNFDAKRIAYRLDVIAKNRYKEIDEIIEKKYKGVSNE